MGVGVQLTPELLWQVVHEVLVDALRASEIEVTPDSRLVVSGSFFTTLVNGDLLEFRYDHYSERVIDALNERFSESGFKVDDQTMFACTTPQEIVDHAYEQYLESLPETGDR